MKQVFESILGGLTTKISDFFHYSPSNSHNKSEYHFHGTVNIIGNLPQAMKSKVDSLFPRLTRKKNKI